MEQLLVLPITKIHHTVSVPPSCGNNVGGLDVIAVLQATQILQLAKDRIISGLLPQFFHCNRQSVDLI